MLLAGLTGGVGMGKSTVAEFLSRRGEPVIDTDILARQLVEPGQPALAEIREAFGGDILDDAGRLNRRALAERVFASGERRRLLESILHPRIRAEWTKQAEEWRKSGIRRAFVVIPLLFETAAESEFGWILCVCCSERTQRERLRERGWSNEELERRIQAQWPAGQKMDRANGVIWNEGPMNVCWMQTARLLEVMEELRPIGRNEEKFRQSEVARTK